MKHRLFAFSSICILPLCSQAATSYIGSASTDDNINIAANWSNNLPSAGNDGTIGIDAELSSLNVNTAGSVIVNHTSGQLGDINNEFTNSWIDATFQNSNGSGTLTWYMSGGSLTNFRVMNIAGVNTTTNISGGTITAFSVGGARLQTVSNGVINFSGGVFDRGYFWANDTSIINLLGGMQTNATAGFRSDDAGSTLNIGGSFSLTSWASNGTAFQDNNGAINFLTGWTGSIADRDNSAIWTDAEWISEFTTVGITYDGMAVDGSNFGTYFQVGTDGSLSAVPEPSNGLLLIGTAAGMLFHRRRK